MVSSTFSPALTRGKTFPPPFFAFFFPPTLSAFSHKYALQRVCVVNILGHWRFENFCPEHCFWRTLLGCSQKSQTYSRNCMFVSTLCKYALSSKDGVVKTVLRLFAWPSCLQEEGDDGRHDQGSSGVAVTEISVLVKVQQRHLPTRRSSFLRTS